MTELKKVSTPAKSNAREFIKDVLSLVKQTEVELVVDGNVYKKDSENNFDLTFKVSDTSNTNVQISNSGKLKIKHEIKT